MDWLPLEIFPVGGLASSVITAVWVGVIVVTFFNLRFGTTLSGLVIPGYLVPLFLLKPVSAWVVIAESLLTYMIARLIAERALVKLELGEMFGRDRFFVLILISIIVRVISDAFILPALSEELVDWGVSYDLRSNLHSFGLIIIALTANQFWNSGFKMGAVTLSLYLGVTFLLIQFVLIPLTNFNISTLGYMYEDVASSILASPKAYIILVTAAFIASRMNLLYGWDFNGILIPSLLALQWYDPIKIVATFVEAFVILLSAQALLKIPIIKQMNIEGARQILFFFNVGFLYKLILGYVIILWIPEQKITDLYGFGYLLSTLIAIKMFQKGIAIRFTRTTIQTSLVATVIASVIGFSLTLFQKPTVDLTVVEHDELLVLRSKQTLSGFIEKLRTESYQSTQLKEGLSYDPLFREKFRDLFETIKQSLKRQPAAITQEMLRLAKAVDYSVTLVEERYWVLHDRQPERGLGFYVFDAINTSDLTIEVPRAIEEGRVAAIAERVFQVVNAKYLAFSSARSSRARDGSDDVLLNSQSIFQIFHQVFANETLQLREYSADVKRLDRLDDESMASLWIKKQLPSHLSLSALEAVIGKFSVHWQAPAFQNRQRDTSLSTFTELFFNRESIVRVLAATAIDSKLYRREQAQRIDGYLQRFLAENKQYIAGKYSQLYVPALPSELLYFDQFVLSPLMQLVDAYGEDDWEQQAGVLLNPIAEAANQFGYEVFIYRHQSTETEYFILQERHQKEGDDLGFRYWGTYVIKLGSASNYLIEVPSPLFETGSFELASVLFEQMNARALLISGHHPRANIDGSSIITINENRFSLFNLFHQHLLRHYQNIQPHAIQVRGYSSENQETASIKLGHYVDQKPDAMETASFLDLKKTLENTAYFQNDNQHSLVIEQVSGNTQAQFTQFIPTAQYSEIWIPTSIRKRFRRIDEETLLFQSIVALDFPIEYQSMASWLGLQRFQPINENQFKQLEHRVERYLRYKNIVEMYQLRQSIKHLTMHVVIDNNTEQLFLGFKDKKTKRWVALANLSPASKEKVLFNEQNSDQQSIQFINNRSAWLYKEST